MWRNTNVVERAQKEEFKGMLGKLKGETPSFKEFNDTVKYLLDEFPNCKTG